MADVQAAAWQERYFACAQTTSIETSGDFSTDLGIDDATDYGLLLTNHAEIDPGITISDQRKIIGEATRKMTDGYEYVPTTYLPVTTLEMDANAWNVAFFGWLLYQKGVTETDQTDKWLYVIDPPTASEGPACEVWCSIVRDLRTASKSHALHGGIVSSMTISGNQGEPLKLSLDIVGRGYASALDASGYTWTPTEKAPLLFQNAVTTLAGTSIDLESFSITYTNGAISKHYNATNVKKHLIGDCTATGSFRMPWGTDTVGQNSVIAALIANNGAELVIGFPDVTVDTAGDLVLTTICRYTGHTIAADDELISDVPFEAAEDAGSYAYKIEAETDVSLGVPA